MKKAHAIQYIFLNDLVSETNRKADRNSSIPHLPPSDGDIVPFVSRNQFHIPSAIILSYLKIRTNFLSLCWHVTKVV